MMDLRAYGNSNKMVDISDLDLKIWVMKVYRFCLSSEALSISAPSLKNGCQIPYTVKMRLQKLKHTKTSTDGENR